MNHSRSQPSQPQQCLLQHLSSTLDIQTHPSAAQGHIVKQFGATSWLISYKRIQMHMTTPMRGSNFLQAVWRWNRVNGKNERVRIQYTRGLDAKKGHGGGKRKEHGSHRWVEGERWERQREDVDREATEGEGEWRRFIKNWKKQRRRWRRMRGEE